MKPDLKGSPFVSDTANFNPKSTKILPKAPTEPHTMLQMVRSAVEHARHKLLIRTVSSRDKISVKTTT